MTGPFLFRGTNHTDQRRGRNCGAPPLVSIPGAGTQAALETRLGAAHRCAGPNGDLACRRSGVYWGAQFVSRRASPRPMAPPARSPSSGPRATSCPPSGTTWSSTGGFVRLALGLSFAPFRRLTSPARSGPCRARRPCRPGLGSSCPGCSSRRCDPGSGYEVSDHGGIRTYRWRGRARGGDQKHLQAPQAGAEPRWLPLHLLDGRRRPRGNLLGSPPRPGGVRRALPGRE